MRIVYTFLLISLFASTAYSQNGNFRSLASGTWSVPSTWERDSDGDGIYEDSPSDFAPSFLDGTIIIRNTHTVRVYSNVTIDQTTVNAGGRIAIDLGDVVTVADGAGVDLMVAGIVSTSNETQLVISNGADFEYAKNGGSLPLASWHENSTCTISGVTTAAPLNLNPAGGFGNFRWLCSSQSTTVQLNGTLVNVQGNLSINNTNGQILSFSNASAPTPVLVEGNFGVFGPSRFALTMSAVVTMNITGDFTYLAPNTSMLTTNGGIATMNVGDDVVVENGTFDLSAGSGVGILNVGGDFTNEGTVTESGSSISQINFTRNGIQSFTNIGTISNQIDYSVGASSILNTVGESPLSGRTLVVNGELGVSSTNTTGAITTGVSTGNVRTNFRTYNAGARIVYIGTAPQFIGSGHPTSADVVTEIDNGNNGVTFNTSTFGNTNSSTLTIADDLILTNGNLTIASNGTTRNLVLNGAVTSVSGSILTSGSNTNITISGSGVFGTFPNVNGATIKNLTVSRSGQTVSFANGLNVTGTTTLTSGTIQLGGTTVLGAVSLANGSLLAFPGQSLTIAGVFSSTGGNLSGNAGSALTLSGNTVNTSPITFLAPGNVLGTFILNKTHAGIAATINSPLTIEEALIITDGQLEITGSQLALDNSATFSRASVGSVSGSRPTGAYHLVYTGGSSVSGFEIPVGGVLASLTLNNTSGATVTLSQNLTVTNALTVSGANRSFNLGANSLTVGSVSNSGTINSFASPDFVIQGTLSNSGTINIAGGTISIGGNITNTGGTLSFTTGTANFTGTTSISGSPITFHHFNIENGATVNAPTQLNLTGNFTNGGQFAGSTGTIFFNGTSLQNVSGSQPSDFNNITVNNTTSPVSVSIQSDQNLNGILTLAANAQFDADGSSNTSIFTLVSTASGDAGIAPLPASAQVLGSVTAERFLTAKDNDYRFFSTPVSDASVAEIQADVQVTGTFTGTDNGCNGCEDGPSLRYYQEPFKGAFELGYSATPVTNGTNAELLVVGRGYSMYMWNGGVSKTLHLRGPINRDVVNFTLHHTVSSPAEPTADGWNLVGNPYPSAIQWNNGAGWARSANVDPTVWVWDVVQGIWRSYNYSNSNGNLSNGIIASGQAFWVYVNNSGGAPTMSINENAKAGTSGTYYREKYEVPALTASLASNDVIDFAYINLKNDGTNSYDPGFDSYKPYLGIETLSLSFLDQDGKRLGYFGSNRSDIAELEIPISVGAKYPGEYKLAFEFGEGGEQFENYFVWDRFLNSYSKITGPYKFTITGDPASAGARFVLTKSSRHELSLEELVRVYPNPASDKFTVEVNDNSVVGVSLINSVGQNIKQIELERTENRQRADVDVSLVPQGIYFLKVVTATQQVRTFKVIKK